MSNEELIKFLDLIAKLIEETSRDLKVAADIVRTSKVSLEKVSGSI